MFDLGRMLLKVNDTIYGLVPELVAKDWKAKIDRCLIDTVSRFKWHYYWYSGKLFMEVSYRESGLWLSCPHDLFSFGATTLFVAVISYFHYYDVDLRTDTVKPFGGSYVICQYALAMIFKLRTFPRKHMFKNYLSAKFYDASVHVLSNYYWHCFIAPVHEVATEDDVILHIIGSGVDREELASFFDDVPSDSEMYSMFPNYSFTPNLLGEASLLLKFIWGNSIASATPD